MLQFVQRLGTAFVVNSINRTRLFIRVVQKGQAYRCGSNQLGEHHSAAFYSTMDRSGKKRFNMTTLTEKYHDKIPLTMVTATDHPSSLVCDRSQIDMILVGDSLAMTSLGHNTTLPVTMDQMIHHCQAVTRGSQNAMVIADMPFGSYEPSVEIAVENAVRLVKKSEVHAVKLEGGEIIADRVKAIVQAGIPVVGHIGLTPQRVNSMGGFKVQGKSAHECAQLVRDAQALETAGCMAIVLECIPASVAKLITEQVLSIPTIGIGSGAGCSGQVLVYHDILGMFEEFVPKFCKRYAHVNPILVEAISKYREEVELGTFPSKEHTFKIPSVELKAFKEYLGVSHLPSISKAHKENLAFKSDRTNIVVIGSGGMACSLVAKLSEMDAYNVTMLGHWKEGIEAIRRRGITLTMDDSEIESQSKRHIRPSDILATTKAEEIIQSLPDGRIDIVFVLTKTYRTESYADDLKRLAQSTTGNPVPLITLQNGIGNQEKIRHILREKGVENCEVISGVTYDGAWLPSPGYVVSSSAVIRILLPQVSHESKMRDFLNRNRILSDKLHKVSLEEGCDTESLVWEKLIVNAAINPISSLLRVRNGLLLNSSHTADVMAQVIREALAVAKHLSHPVKLPSLDVGIFLNRAMETLRTTAHNRSSMLTDVDKGSAFTEIDDINGAIVKLADEIDMGHLVPCNRMLVQMIHARTCLAALK